MPLEEWLLSNNSPRLGESEGPLGREADAVGSGAVPLPQLLEQGGAALPCYPSWAVLCKGPGFIYRMDKGYIGPSLPSFFSKATPSDRDPHPPHVEPLHLCVATCHLQVTCPQGSPFIPFPLKWNRSIREAPESLSTAPGM